MNHRCRMMHRLRRGIGPVVFILPVEYAHTQKPIEDLVPILPWDATMQLFANPDHVPPQPVVVMNLGQEVVHPDVLIEVLDVRSVVQHPNGNLESPRSQQTTPPHFRAEDLVVVRVCSHPPTYAANAMLAFVFSGNPGPAWDHERCARQEDLATKDCVATVELVSFKWYGHWCRGRVVERIVGKQVER